MKYRNLFVFSILVTLFSGCQGWLGQDGPMSNRVDEFFTNKKVAEQVTTAAYVPLMWEFNSTYYSEFFFGDVMSDDALKGGQNTQDMSASYDMENFRTIANNIMVLDYYRAQYQGIARANLAIEQIPSMEISEDFTTQDHQQFEGEARFLRALYYFRLTKLFGGVPIIDKPIYSSDKWKQPRASVEEVYQFITTDLVFAADNLPAKSKYPASEMGRATSGAAQALLMKVYLYWGNYKENTGDNAGASEMYAQALKYGNIFMSSQASEYSLCNVYDDNFTLEGENGQESIFEVQYMCDAMSDYGEGNGFSRGTFATILTRSRSSSFENAGWGFCKPTRNLYEEFEEGDTRREAAIIVPSDEEIVNPVEEIYLGCRNVSKKRTLMSSADRKYIKLDHDSRSPINRIEIRLADVYLLYAEICLENGQTDKAKEYLEKVRARARGGKDVLPEFPEYKVPDYTKAYALHQLTDTPEDLEMAIRHERRVELAMESHRWYDLCRWGIAKEVMDAYKASESLEVRSEMSDFIKGKHELLPIPEEEIRLGVLEQNPGY